MSGLPSAEEENASRGESADSAVEFLLTFARAGHRAGYPTADLEERIAALADSAGLEGAQVSATPTIVEISLGSLPRQRRASRSARSPDRSSDAAAATA